MFILLSIYLYLHSFVFISAHLFSTGRYFFKQYMIHLYIWQLRWRLEGRWLLLSVNRCCMNFFVVHSNIIWILLEQIMIIIVRYKDVYLSIYLSTRVCVVYECKLLAFVTASAWHLKWISSDTHCPNVTASITFSNRTDMAVESIYARFSL